MYNIIQDGNCDGDTLIDDDRKVIKLKGNSLKTIIYKQKNCLCSDYGRSEAMLDAIAMWNNIRFFIEIREKPLLSSQYLYVV